MKIGALSEQTGVSRDTIRFYESKGLLTNITRPFEWNNYKDYGDENIKRIQIVQYLKQFSFTLRECKELLEMRDANPNDCTDKTAFFKKKLQIIEKQITDLQETRKKLLELLKK